MWKPVSVLFLFAIPDTFCICRSLVGDGASKSDSDLSDDPSNEIHELQPIPVGADQNPEFSNPLLQDTYSVGSDSSRLSLVLLADDETSSEASSIFNKFNMNQEDTRCAGACTTWSNVSPFSVQAVLYLQCWPYVSRTKWNELRFGASSLYIVNQHTCSFADYEWQFNTSMKEGTIKGVPPILSQMSVQIKNLLRPLWTGWDMTTSLCLFTWQESFCIVSVSENVLV